MFRRLMAEFGEQIGLQEPIEIDDEGFCSFDVGEVTVAMQGMAEIETFSISAIVGAPPPESLEQLYRELLAANHNFQGTNGATLSLDPRTGTVHLCRFVPYAALDAERLVAIVGNFITTLLDWHAKVANFRAEVADGPMPTDARPEEDRDCVLLMP